MRPYRFGAFWGMPVYRYAGRYPYLFDRRLYAVRCASMYKLLGDLREFPDTNSCFAFGDAHHLTLRRDGEDVMRRLQEYLKGKGYAAVSIERLEPSVEVVSWPCKRGDVSDDDLSAGCEVESWKIRGFRVRCEVESKNARGRARREVESRENAGSRRARGRISGKCGPRIGRRSNLGEMRHCELRNKDKK